MANYILHLARNYPISCFYIMFIWIMCFADVPDTPLKNVSLIDKWVHMLAYAGTCATIWLEYRRRHDHINKLRVVLLALLAPIAMGGIIELLQAICTGGRRSGEWLDFAANTIGVVAGNVIGILLAAYRAKSKKD